MLEFVVGLVLLLISIIVLSSFFEKGVESPFSYFFILPYFAIGMSALLENFEDGGNVLMKLMLSFMGAMPAGISFVGAFVVDLF